MILILMGVTGSGKTTIGQLLSRQLGWEFRDADGFHSAANVAKMRAAIPLTDEDRRPWLESIRAYIQARFVAGQHSIIACSALKEAYRQILGGDDSRIQFVYLKGEVGLLRDRLEKRRGHYMNPALLQSQIDTLEVPRDVFTATIDQTPEEIAARIRDHFHI